MALAGTPMYFPPEVAARIFDERCDIPLTAKADVFALALSLLHSIEEPNWSELEASDVDTFLKKRVTSVPSGPRTRELAFLRPYFERWLAPHPNDRPTAGQLADEIAAIRASRGGRARIAAPAGLRGALVALAASALTLTCTLLVDVPPRPVDRPSVEALDETERVRLLRHRLEEEQRRGRELERALERLRRRELDVEDRPIVESADSDGEPREGAREPR
jgi:hypothetical protein